MISKIILTIIVLAICFLIVHVTEQNVAPQHATNLVIEGVKNIDNMADNQAQMRTEQNAQNWLDVIIYFLCLGFLIWIWKRPIQKTYLKKI